MKKFEVLNRIKIMERAFSLVEVLVTVVIMGILMLLGMRFYSEQKKSSYTTWAKAEMTDIFQLMRTAQSYDDYYHQFIYAMGYRPKGQMLASVGTAADSYTICCDKYPEPGADPCVKNWRSGYLYYNCKTDSLNTATDNIEICNDIGYGSSCEILSGLNTLQTGRFSACPPQPVKWCNCDQFTLGGITVSARELTLNEQKIFCEGI